MWYNYTFYVYVWILVFLVAELVICEARIEGGWNSAPKTQYHIQTDEGEERYFRYQTLTGQYRKEKRLQDGSVVGTYGWVDADGYLRLKDYVADDQGYRIVRSKKVYVGEKAPIDQAVHASKYAPNEVAKPAYNAYSPVHNEVSTPSYNTYAPVHNEISTPSYNAYAPVNNDVSTPSYNAYAPVQSDVTTPSYNAYVPVQSDVSTPSYDVYEPDQADASRATYNTYDSNRVVEIKPNYKSYVPIQTSTPSPLYKSYAHEIDNSISSTSTPYKSNEYDSYLIAKSVSQTERPLEFPSHSSSSSSPIVLSDYLQSGSEIQTQHEVAITPHYRYAISTTSTPPTPIYVTSTIAPKPVTFRPYYNPNVVSSEFNYVNKNLGKESSEYDGVSLTHNGFKYYLPKQYHEEDGSSSSHRAGSFGYIDPFGIRRVIYYNTSPEKGFVARKNNRYVGLDATPYDPRF